MESAMGNGVQPVTGALMELQAHLTTWKSKPYE
jgi:hypothetical protein